MTARSGAASAGCPAARLGLGALGVLVDLTVQTVPTFVLAADEHPEPLDAVLDDWPNRSAQADHVEFYWFPHTRLALTRNNTRLPADAPRTPPGRLAQPRVRSLGDLRPLRKASSAHLAVRHVSGQAPGVTDGFRRVVSTPSTHRREWRRPAT